MLLIVEKIWDIGLYCQNVNNENFIFNRVYFNDKISINSKIS